MTIERVVMDRAFLLEVIYRNGKTLGGDPRMPAAARRMLAESHAEFCVRLAADLGLWWDDATGHMVPLS